MKTQILSLKFWRNLGKRLTPWLDGITLLAWGILLIKYWLTGRLAILIHPNYFSLTVMAALCLLILGSLRLYEIWKVYQRQLILHQTVPHAITPNPRHEPMNLLPKNWGSGLLLITAIIGLLVTPRTFASQTALERGITESLPVTRLQPQEFKNVSKPEERSLIEWIKLLNFNPEPDTYKGQKVKLQGFVVHPPSLSEQYLWISRFVITCCAADAYPIGLPVKLPPGETRRKFPSDKWLEITGEMMTEELQTKRKLVIKADTLTPIPEPKNPYDY